MKYYLISTDHLTDKIWFHDDEDFKTGMNLVAVACFTCRTRILDFILMSNHVHFVVLGALEEARQFIDYFKLLYGKYMRTRYGCKHFLRHNDVDIRQIDPLGEGVERVIAYTQMNCVAANICAYPNQYPWGCGSLPFSKSTDKPGVSLGSLSVRAQRKLLHSHMALPSEYRVLPAGYISPASYVAVKDVEAIFRTPKRLLYFLNNSSKAKNRLSEDAMPSFRDQVIASSVTDLCYSLFRKSSLQDLSSVEKGELLRQLRYRFSADVAQLARVTGIPYQDACRLLDAFQ